MKHLNLVILLSLMMVTSISFGQNQPTFNAGEDPKPPGKKWEKIEILSDEFSGSSLNTNKWAVNFPFWKGRAPGLFTTDAVSLVGGEMRITVDFLTQAEKNANPGFEYQGGLVRSVQDTKYGYYECRVKGNKTFMSTTFWLINQRNELNGCDKRVTELDITETVGIVTPNAPGWVTGFDEKMNSNTHSRDIPSGCNFPSGSKGNKADLGEKSWQGYHTYGVWWKSATEVLFYLDGQFVGQVAPAADFDIDMYLRFVVESYDWNPDNGNTNPATGLRWDGVNDNFVNRTSYYDWVRSWRLVDDNTPVVQAPFGGVNRNIPGTIEAEDFDTGGQGVAYNDSDPTNNGNNVARENEAVDIEARDGGITVGWGADGEWLEYTVNATGGTYSIEGRFAAITSGKTVTVKLDGATLGTLNVPNTGDWGTFQTVSINNITVPGGNDKVLRLELNGGGINLNWVKFVSGGPGNIDVTGVNVTPNIVPTLTAAGATTQLGVDITPSNATNQNVTWSSSNSGVATVNSSGLVTAVANGTTTITATSVSNTNVSGSEGVTVNISNQGGCNPPYSVATQQVNGNQSLNQTFGPFDISCSNVDISFTAVGSGGLESSGGAQDNLGVFYKVDGGANQPILDISGVYAQNNLSATNISGNSLELVIIMNTTGGSENYTVSNINIAASSSNPPTGNNLLSNPGFETGDLTSYGSWGGVSVVSNNQRTGSFAVTVNGAGAPSQVVNVSPNTTYTFSVWGRVAAGGQSVNVGVKDHDAPETTSQLTSTSYTQVSHTFTTGANATTAQVYFYCPNASYQAWGDDFELTVATTGARTSKSATQSPIKETLIDENIPSLVYPNPLGERALKVNLSGYDEGAEIRVVDTMGRLIYQTKTDQSALDLSPTIFTTKGMYLINIKGSGKAERLKLLVQ